MHSCYLDIRMISKERATLYVTALPQREDRLLKFACWPASLQIKWMQLRKQSSITSSDYVVITSALQWY